MKIPTGATHQHDQTKRYYRKDQYGFWEYWDGDIWCQSICNPKGSESERLKTI